MYRALVVWVSLVAPLGTLLGLPSSWVALLAAGLPLLLTLGVRQYELPRAPPELADKFRNIVIAHRGGQIQLPAGSKAAAVAAATEAATAAAVAAEEPDPSALPENTLAAFRWASSAACNGADAIELDVWLSRDGVPMVNHDPSVVRNYDGEGLISNMTAAELKKLKLLPKPKHSHTNLHPRAIHPDHIRTECMPTLEEVLDMLSSEAPHMKCMIEVKERTQVGAMCQALGRLYAERPWMYERCFVAAFNPLVLRGVRAVDARIVTSYLFIDAFTTNLIRSADELRIPVPGWLRHNVPLRWAIDDLIWWLGTSARGLALLGASLSACESKALTENQIRRDRANGIITSTWVVNNEHQKEWLLQLGVTVITDLQFNGGTPSASPRPQLL